MPPLAPVPSVLKVNHEWGIGSDLTAISRWHLLYSGGPPTDADCNALASSMYTQWEVIFAGYCGTDIAFLGISIEDLTSPTSGIGSHTGSSLGTRTGGPMPAGVCGLANGPIGRRYRGGKPRTYFPIGVPGDLATANTWASSFITNINAAFAALIADYKGDSSGTTSISEVVNVSYYEGFTSVTNPITGRTKDVPKQRTGGPVTDVIAAYVLNPKLGSQRRRNLHST